MSKNYKYSNHPIVMSFGIIRGEGTKSRFAQEKV